MFEKVRQFLCDNLSLEPDMVTMDSLFGEDLGADSLDLMEMEIVLENELGISISDEDFTNMETVGDLVKHLESRVQGA